MKNNLQVTAYVLFPAPIKTPTCTISGVFTTEYFSYAESEWKELDIEEGTEFMTASMEELAEIEADIYANKADNHCLAVVVTNLKWSNKKGK